MADILIRGLRMPKIGELPRSVLIYPWYKTAISLEPGLDDYEVVELPDHGRLIDADAFAAKYVASLPDALAALKDPKNIPAMKAVIQALLLDIAEAETIIPASKEANNAH